MKQKLVKQKRSFDSERGGFIRATRGNSRNGRSSNGNGRGQYQDEPYRKSKEVPIVHQARDLIVEAVAAGLSEGAEVKMIATISAMDKSNLAQWVISIKKARGMIIESRLLPDLEVGLIEKIFTTSPEVLDEFVSSGEFQNEIDLAFG